MSDYSLSYSRKLSLLFHSLFAASLVMVVGRFFIPGHDLSWSGTYEAFAHILVGILIVMCFHREKCIAIPSRWMLLGSSLFELVMFLRR